MRVNAAFIGVGWRGMARPSHGRWHNPDSNAQRAVLVTGGGEVVMHMRIGVDQGSNRPLNEVAPGLVVAIGNRPILIAMFLAYCYR